MNDVISNEYINDLKHIKETIRQNQNKAMVVVNSAMIMTYYEIGTIINRRKIWGNKYVQKLSEDLKEYGKGYSYDQLKRMARFAKEFSVDEIRAQAAPQIPWFTIIEIMHKSKSHEEILWYINQAHKKGWSRSQVLHKFKEQAYERNLIEQDTSISIKNDSSINEIIKDTYVFDFLNITNTTSEKNLKEALLDNVIEFLHELGPGFALMDKEYKLVTPSGKTFFIDLLMYHTKIHCYIVIELKIGEFSPSDLGQLGFYVKAIDKLEKTDKDEETIGILLCKSADKIVAETTLESSAMKIGISKYKVLESLPEYLEEKLNKKRRD
ncbi:MAG: PDDEXK nuclease domain-containing protein [bacterium]|nr:PDDEXK nuclease domain-containing protein [bacterium]